jgi:hypothetical protein
MVLFFKIAVVFLLLCGRGLLGFAILNIFRIFDFFKFSYGYFGLFSLRLFDGVFGLWFFGSRRGGFF